MEQKREPCPKNWDPQDWGRHLARLEFMRELGRGHYSRTDPKWHVKKFREQLLAEERDRVLKLISRRYGKGEKDPRVNAIAEEILGGVQP